MSKYGRGCTYSLLSDYQHLLRMKTESFIEANSCLWNRNTNKKRKQGHKRKKKKNKSCRENKVMVGERHRREPKNEADKWQKRSKVWNIL